MVCHPGYVIEDQSVVSTWRMEVQAGLVWRYSLLLLLLLGGAHAQAVSSPLKNLKNPRHSVSRRLGRYFSMVWVILTSRENLAS